MAALKQKTTENFSASISIPAVQNVIKREKKIKILMTTKEKILKDEKMK